MFELIGVAPQMLANQLMLGLINGAFYALLSLGLAVIFGLMNVINFAHGAQYMLGAFGAWVLLDYLGVSYWAALFIAPICVGAVGMLLERLLISRLYDLDHLYGLLLTFGLALMMQGLVHAHFGAVGHPYPNPMPGGINLGYLIVPYNRAFVAVVSLVVCLGIWLLIERTQLGAYLRAASERADLVQAFGVNVPLMMTLTYGLGVALAALAGVLAAPIYLVNPNMGVNLIIVVFAVVVIGGMGSIIGAVISGFGLGLVEGLTKVFYPEASSTIIFVLMAVVLLIRPRGLFGARQ